GLEVAAGDRAAHAAFLEELKLVQTLVVVGRNRPVHLVAANRDGFIVEAVVRLIVADFGESDQQKGRGLHAPDFRVMPEMCKDKRVSSIARRTGGAHSPGP
ncbi:MAG: hypothetical protein QE494_17890, partial [Ramlibacter sp.]|nr:hypothetical protein [Ramlibacter sp.]